MWDGVFVKIFGLKYIPKMEVYIILAKTGWHRSLQKQKGITFADRFLFCYILLDINIMYCYNVKKLAASNK
jgi:hypothetical protein